MIHFTKLASSLSLSQKQTLELLSAALYDREPNSELFRLSCDWRDIERIAQEQSVVALVVNSMLRLPRDLQPERTHRLELALQEDLISKHSQKHHQRLRKIYQDYEQEGFFVVMLKGVSMAMLYPRPELRSLGDVDLYLPKEGEYERANIWAQSLGYRLFGASVYEQAYKRDGLVVENHRLLTYFGIAEYDKVLSEIMRDIREQERWDYITLQSQKYRVLPLELNAVYVFHHILHHFSYLGIGLRQICDWVLLMHHYGERLDRDLFLDYAKRLDLLRPMKLFALMAVNYLGAGAEVFPFTIPQDKRSLDLANLIIRDTFVGGNFGFEHFSGKKFTSIWTRRWFMFKRTTWRSLHVAPISPEHIRKIPLIAISTRLKLLFRRSNHNL